MIEYQKIKDDIFVAVDNKPNWIQEPVKVENVNIKVEYKFRPPTKPIDKIGMNLWFDLFKNVNTLDKLEAWEKELSRYNCDCSPLYLKLKRENRYPPLSFEWKWDLKNNVNKKLKKPTLNLEDAQWIHRFNCDRGPVHFLVTKEDLVKDTKYLTELIHSRHPNLKGIAGVARSGMLPATMIALDLGLELYEATEKELWPIPGGVRRTGNIHGTRRQDSGEVVIVDDSTCSGHAYNQLKHHGCSFYTVYGGHIGKDQIDGYAIPLELPHLFEWNLFHNGIIFNSMNAGFDLDGVFCEDCPLDCDDDGEKYLDWMKRVRPLHYSIEYKVKHIITARREEYRKQTLRWLGKYGIEVENLIMFPGSFEERSRTNIGQWKAEHAKRLGCHLFVESSYQQCTEFVKYHPMCVVVSMERPQCFGQQI